MVRLGRIAWTLLPALCLLLACSGPGKIATQLEISLAEPEISAEAGSVFVRVASNTSWTLEIVPAVEWATLNADSGSGDRNSVILSCQSNPDETARSLSVVATASDGKLTSSVTFRQRGRVAPPSGGNEGSGSAVATDKWLELPATSASDGYDYFCHWVDVDGKAVRNWSFYWNAGARVSMWVAYPLCSLYLGSQSRSDAWGYDPLLPAVRQQNVSGGYRVGNNGFYDRGHQLPSADRTASYAMNATTFYGTNMTPQNGTLNQNIWAQLENKVRDWSKLSDTLYVVTGCTVDGATHYVLDRSDAKITVPTGYFKAVIRYKKDSTVGYSGYMGAAFWFDHEGVTWSGKKFSKEQALSIEALERKLGYTLFVNLPERVGTRTAAQIKSEDPATMTWWWNN